MGRITIVTAGDKKFKEHVLRSKKAAEGFGYNVVVYDLGGLGFGKELETPVEDLKKHGHGFISCLFKHTIIEETLKEHARVVYVDGDALLVKPIDSVFDDEFDVGVTMRTSKEIRQYLGNDKVGYFNSGVLFFQQNQRTFDFLKAWRADSAACGVEQEAVNRMIMPHVQWDPKSKTRAPAFVDAGGYTVRILDCLDYNNFYRDKKRASIVHYKNTVK